MFPGVPDFVETRAGRAAAKAGDRGLARGTGGGSPRKGRVAGV